MEDFEILRRMYRETLPEKQAALEAEWRALASGIAPEQRVQLLRRQLHQLSGSGGAYGYDAMGDLARELERCWGHWLNLPALNRPDALALQHELTPLMDKLLAAMRTAAFTSDAAG